MIRTIHLHGFLGKKYGKTVQLAGDNMYQIMAGLTSRFGPEFKEDIRTNNWHIVEGSIKPGNDMDVQDLPRNLKKKTLHLLPEVKGESAALRVVLGVIIIIIGVYFDSPQLVAMGTAMVLGGVTSMLTKPPKSTASQAINDQGSYLYNAAVNVTSQGGPVPRVYGHFPRASSVIISTDFSNDEIGTPTVSTAAPSSGYSR